jgi:hypothetical protein
MEDVPRILDHVYGGRSGDANAMLLQQGFLMRYSGVTLQAFLMEASLAEHSDEVFRQQHTSNGVVAPSPAPCVCLENVVPPQLVAALAHALRPEAPFWSEHQLRVPTSCLLCLTTVICPGTGSAPNTSRTGTT